MKTRRGIRTSIFSAFIVLAGILPSSLSATLTNTETVGHQATEIIERSPVLMISIDGLRPDSVLQADKYGLRIPVLRSFLTKGSYAQQVINVNPTVTNPNHTTLVTGVLPRVHGIYNNRPFAAAAKLPQSYRFYSQIKAPTLWRAAKEAGLTTGSLFWPVTREAEDIDFNVVEGDSEDDDKIADEAITLIERQRPQLLTVHFVSHDHQQHEFGLFSAQGNAAIERIDAAVGRVIAVQRKTYPDSIIVVTSDHGFYKVTQEVNPNTALVEAGFITLGDGPDKSVTSWKAFVWYVGGMGMVVLQDPHDKPMKAHVSKFLQKLADDPENGIERIYSRDEIVDLGLSPEAEFVIAFKEGYRMGAAVEGPLRMAIKGGGHGAFSTHTVRPDMHSSFFIVGPGVAAGRNIGTIDMRQIAPTLAGQLKLALPSADLPPLALGDE